MNFSWFRDLQALQQLGSFSKASEAQNRSRPALTRRIKALEVWAEQQLVERERRPVTLTIAGQTLLETSIEFLNMLEVQRLNMLSQARQAGKTRSGLQLSIPSRGISFRIGSTSLSWSLALYRPGCWPRISRNALKACANRK